VVPKAAVGRIFYLRRPAAATIKESQPGGTAVFDR
jgi:hypothetical protein